MPFTIFKCKLEYAISYNRTKDDLNPVVLATNWNYELKTHEKLNELVLFALFVVQWDATYA